jgi:hypothetical protein
VTPCVSCPYFLIILAFWRPNLAKSYHYSSTEIRHRSLRFLGVADGAADGTPLQTVQGVNELDATVTAKKTNLHRKSAHLQIRPCSVNNGVSEGRPMAKAFPQGGDMHCHALSLARGARITTD